MLTGTMNTELLRKVCQTPGAPGFENAIREFIIKEITPLVDSISVDASICASNDNGRCTAIWSPSKSAL